MTLALLSSQYFENSRVGTLGGYFMTPSIVEL